MRHFASIALIVLGLLFDFGYQPSLRAAENKEALWAAARTGDVKTLESLLAKGVDVNASNEIGITALWLAASKGQLGAVKVLVKHKADVNVRDGIWYQTPLSQAISDGKLEMARVLLDAGADDADALLLGAAGRGQLSMVRLLLEKRQVRPDTLSAALAVLPCEPQRNCARRLSRQGPSRCPQLPRPIKLLGSLTWASTRATTEAS